MKNLSALTAFKGLLPVVWLTTGLGWAVGDEAPRFTPDWDSLQGYQCPDWFRDAKFGIYAHWGPYAVAEGPENTDWYSRNMYRTGTQPNRFHRANWGELDEFGYKDFIPRFQAEKFDADEWAQLYVEAGARFAGPVAEHADGFAMWDSALTPWNATAMGPQRDIVAEMETAVRAKGLKFLTSFHHHWKWGWYPTMDQSTDTANPQYAALYGPPTPATAFGRRGYDPMRPDPMPSDAFAAEWLAKVEEVVNRYQPDLIWFDNRMQILPETYVQRMAAHFYNVSTKAGREYVLTFKRPDMPLGTGTVDLERSRMPDIYPEPWLTDTSVASNTWAWSHDIEYYSATRLIHDLVDIVSKNGCMLLNIAPKPDGTIPAEQQQLLRDIGAWLRINGEAIYGSRPWSEYGEGPTETPVGHLADEGFDGFSPEDIRFTTKAGLLYAISFGWPGPRGAIEIESLSSLAWAETIERIDLVGSDEVIEFERSKDALRILPAVEPPCGHAWVFRITTKRP